MAILEACASALPVVSTRHAGIPEVIVESETGFLVNEHDMDAMADRMTRFLREPALAAEFGRAGRRRVESSFSIEASNEKLLAIIQESVTSTQGT